MSDQTALITAAKAGSADAFADLVRHYRVRLLRFLVTRCTSHADAEDALQDTLIAAYRYINTYDPRWRFSTWLYRIAIRNAARIRTHDVVDIDDLRDEGNDPLEACIRSSDTENLWLTARRELNTDVFTATWLRYVEDMSIKDISRALDRSESWTKVNLLRARKSLERALNEGREGNEAYG